MTVTIEATGKRWKRMQLWGALCLFFGFTTCSMNLGGGEDLASQALTVLTGLFLYGGGISYLWGRIGAWWNHG